MAEQAVQAEKRADKPVDEATDEPAKKAADNPTDKPIAEGTEAWEPRIIAFLCNWCTYTGADLAGTSRIQYPPNVRVVRVMCSGSVDPLYILRPLLQGVDGVLVGGCHPGDCHYVNGNYKARRRTALLREVLRQFGVDDRRLKLAWVSASEGKLFADTISQMVQELKELGPNQLSRLWEG